MARDEHQAQQVIADVIVEPVLGQRRAAGARFRLALQLRVLALRDLAVSELVERVVARRGGQPRARSIGHAAARPLLERADERVLCEFLGATDVPQHAGEERDDLG